MIYLASTSPRRRELLGSLGVPFEIMAPRFVETPTALPPAGEARHFAEQKASSVLELIPEGWVLGSDTLVALGGEKFGKPRDADDAIRMLAKLSGRAHDVWTGVCLLH